MRSIFFLAFAIISACLASCSSENGEATNNIVLQINPEIVDVYGFMEKVRKIRIIPLETKPEAMIGSILTIEAHKDRFYAFDMQFTKSVFIFDINGKWINTICSIGKGPEEYVNPMQFSIDPFNDELVINDPSTKKILRYDLVGNFKSEIKLDFISSNIGFIDTDSYCFKSMDDNRNPVVVTTDRDGRDRKIVQTGIFEFNMFLFTHFPQYGGKLLFYEYLNDTIYQISREKAEPWHYIDFLDLKVTNSYQKELIAWSRTNKWIPKISDSKAGQIYKYLETDKMIQFGCRFKGEQANVWINKSDNRQFMLFTIGGGVGEKRDPLTDLCIRIGATDEYGNYVSSISTDTYLSLFDNDRFDEYLEKGVIEIENSGFKNQNDVTLESNPVLVVIEMK